MRQGTDFFYAFVWVGSMEPDDRVTSGQFTDNFFYAGVMIQFSPGVEPVGLPEHHGPKNQEWLGNGPIIHIVSRESVRVSWANAATCISSN